MSASSFGPRRPTGNLALGERRESLLPVAVLLISVWIVLLLPSVGSGAPRYEWSTSSYFAALGLLLVTRGSGTCQRAGPGPAHLLAGLFAGVATYPAWIAFIAPAGLALGLELPPAGPPLGFSPREWVVLVLLGPLVEEVLYRDRLFRPIERRFGRPTAVTSTAAVFAVPHLEPWAVLTTFILGLGLGAMRAGSGSISAGLGLHVGLNVAFLVFGAPATDHPLDPEGALAVGLIALLVGLPCGGRRNPPKVPRHRRGVRAAIVVFAGSGFAPSATIAAPTQWEGTISFEFASSQIGDLSVSGTGVAIALDNGNGVTLQTLRIRGGISGADTVLLTDPGTPTLAAVQVEITDVGIGTLAPFDPLAPYGQTQLTSASIPVFGVIRLCLFSTDCSSAISLDLARPSGALGVGGTLTGGTGTIRISIQAAPWTVRTASLPVQTVSGSTVTLFTDGFVHGPSSFTGSTALTGGVVSVVTPMAITSSAGQEFASFARLTVRTIPEPGMLLLLAAGIGGLGALYAIRRR